MTVPEAVWQGLIQGLTEFLPVSSSGHLSVAQHFFGIGGGTALAVSAFLHLGTLAAVLLAFHRQLWELTRELVSTAGDLLTGRFTWKGMSDRRRLLLLLIVSCLPLLAVLPLKDAVERLAGDGDVLTEGVCFLFSGTEILLASRWSRPRSAAKAAHALSFPGALLIGAAQTVATLPGVSRSGSTISAALLCGADRDAAFDYAFVLGTPAILAAAGLELRDAVGAPVRLDWLPLLIGTAVAAAVGYAALRLLSRLVRSGAFRYFGFYCLALGAAVIALGLYERFGGQPVRSLIAGFFR